MQIVVSDHYSNSRHNIEGSGESCRQQMYQEFPWLLSKLGNKATIQQLVKELDRSQNYYAVILDSITGLDNLVKFEEIDQSTDDHPLHQYRLKSKNNGQINNTSMRQLLCKEAAEFLCGHVITDAEFRQGLLECDSKPEVAALIAAGLDPIKDLKDINAILSMALKKSEVNDEPVVFKTVLGVTEGCNKFAKLVNEANDNRTINPISFGEGRHSVGLLVAKTPEGTDLLLKPGSGPQNPALGEEESGLSQCKREACFYACACLMGLGNYLPECHLLLLDGTEYAGLELLSYAYHNFNDIHEEDPNLARRILWLYNDGLLHQWAAMDYILGNPDRNAGNIMASNTVIKLIDHGSAFAGASFNPPLDKYSFIPYYLRAVCPSGFSTMLISDKLRYMPRMKPEDNERVKEWLVKLDPNLLKTVIEGYGIDSSPELQRLAKLQESCQTQPADLAILSAWIVG